jgi:hypothetical protein
MTLGSHQRTVGKSQSWITPKHIIDALGPFDLDPCASDPRPWDCAKDNWTRCGLEWPWLSHWSLWLNPPFDRYQVGKWVRKLADHGNGIALLHARTEADWFLPCWESADSILFLADRLYFNRPDGSRAKANSGAPACLVAFGENCSARLRESGLKGAYVDSWGLQ